MAYYTYFPCPGSTGVQFTSNVAPAYPGAFIQFTSGGPELAPYLGKCYHVAEYTETAPPGTISINWATAIYDSTFKKCEDCVEQPPCGECPEGYELINGECVLTELIPATYTGGLLQITEGDNDVSYTWNGLRLYPDITALPKPLYGYGFSSNLPVPCTTTIPFSVKDNNGAGSVVTPLLASVQSKLWGIKSTDYPGCGLVAGGKLNTVGIGAPSYPTDEELSFDFCVEVEQTKQYLIGIAGDNKVKIYLNGVLQVFLDADGVGVCAQSIREPFTYWHVFPITLSAGSYTITLSGLNLGGDFAFGAEVYDMGDTSGYSSALDKFQSLLAIPATSAPSCGNLPNDTDPYVIFSTKDYIDQYIPDPNDPGVWECPEGYTLDECNGIPQCSITTTVPTSPCAYQLVSCCDPNDTYLASLPILSQELPVNIVIVNPGSSGIPVGCYDVIEYSEQASGVPVLIEDVNYAVNGGCSEYPFICNSYCGECSCTRVRVKKPSGGEPFVLPYWTCNLITNEEGNIVPELASISVPADGSWTDYVCAGGFIFLTNSFEFENKGLCNLDVQTDQFECPKYYQLVDCDNSENTLCVSNDLYNQFINNTVIQVEGYPNTCWSVEEIEEPCQSPINAVITLSFKTCEECTESLKTYYKLINCLNPEIVVYTETDLTTYVGSTIIVNEFPEDCWNVETSALAVTPIPVTGVISFRSCLDCNRQYYLLEDCNTEDPQPNIYTAEDLSAFVGSVITLEFCPEVCWQVSETDATTDNEVVNITGSYISCEPCQIAVLPCQCSRIINNVEAGMRFEYYDCSGLLRLTPVLAYGQASPKVCAKLWIDVNPDDVEYFGDCVDGVCPPDEKPKKSIRPGYNTPACTAEKYEKIVCNFSEAIYKEMMTIRYGVTMCCGDDDLRWKIQKELIYLKSITDPDYNCSIEPGCDCTTSATGLTPCIPE